MPVAAIPFDVVEVKLAAPQIRPGTVAKADVMGAPVLVTLAVSDRGRAGRIRQDDASCTMGRG